jgi:hypothetical protein
MDFYLWVICVVIGFVVVWAVLYIGDYLFRMEEQEMK